jgi:23S rRNA (guanosine2251-2'-O)-methyltransferase
VTELVYGRNSVAETIRAGRRRIHRLLVAQSAHGLDPLLALARERRIPVDVIDRARLDRLVDANHQGVVVEADPFTYAHVRDVLTHEAPLLLALDSLQDPQNFGTLLRTALAVGVNGVLIAEHRAVGVTPAVSNASAGAVEHLDVAQVTNLARALRELKDHGVWVFGLAVQAHDAFWSADLTGPLALVVGSEGSGLSRVVREACDVLVQIPMVMGSIQSLNASVAGSLVLYEAFRQRTSSQGYPGPRT